MELKTKKKILTMKYLRHIFGIKFHHKCLYKVNQYENEKILNQINDSIIELRSSVNNKEYLRSKIQNKIIHILEKINKFNKQQKDKESKILILKQVFQRLPKIPAQVQAGNTSENLPNEICQIIYFLYRAKEISKNVYNNIMNSTNL